MSAAATPPARHRLLRRLALLVLCLGAGAAVGGVVAACSGSAWGWVAVPLALAIGWLVVADPTQCDCRG